jgi:hypothetical protein
MSPRWHLRRPLSQQIPSTSAAGEGERLVVLTISRAAIDVFLDQMDEISFAEAVFRFRARGQQFA